MVLRCTKVYTSTLLYASLRYEDFCLYPVYFIYLLSKNDTVVTDHPVSLPVPGSVHVTLAFARAAVINFPGAEAVEAVV